MKKFTALLLTLCLLLASASALAASSVNEAMLVLLQKATDPSQTTETVITVSVSSENLLNLLAKISPNAADTGSMQNLGEQYGAALDALLAHMRIEGRMSYSKGYEARIMLDEQTLADYNLYGDFDNLTEGNSLYITSCLFPSTALKSDASAFQVNPVMHSAMTLSQELTEILAENPDMKPMREVLANAYHYAAALAGDAESVTLTGAEFAELDAQTAENRHLLLQSDSAFNRIINLYVGYMYETYAAVYSTAESSVPAQLYASKPDVSTVKLNDMLTVSDDDRITITRSGDSVVFSRQYEGTYWDESYNQHTVPSEDTLTFKPDYFTLSSIGASPLIVTLDARAEGMNALRVVGHDFYAWLNETDTADGGRYDGKLSVNVNGLMLDVFFGEEVKLNGEMSYSLKLATDGQEIISAAMTQGYTDEVLPELDLSRYQVVTVNADGTMSEADTAALMNDMTIGAAQIMNTLMTNLPEGAESIASLLAALMGQTGQ